jgi:hypothetical protein
VGNVRGGLQIDENGVCMDRPGVKGAHFPLIFI